MIKDVVVKIAEKEIRFQAKDIYIFSVWQVFHNATHKVCVEQSSDTLTRFSNSGFCHLGVNFFVFLSKFENKNRFEILVKFPDRMWYLKRPDD